MLKDDFTVSHSLIYYTTFPQRPKITKVKNVEKYKNNVIRKFHSRPIPRLFLRHNFLRPRLRLFFYTKFFETETKTFFKTRFMRTYLVSTGLSTAVRGYWSFISFYSRVLLPQARFKYWPENDTETIFNVLSDSGFGWQCIKTNLETKIFWECHLKTLLHKKYLKKCYLYLFGLWYQHS